MADRKQSGVKLRPRQKYQLINKLTMDIGLLCNIARVSRSGYYRWLKNADKPNKDYADYLLIKAIHEKGRGKYGWRTIQMKLQVNMGITMNHKKIQRIKIKYQLFTKIRRINPYKMIMKKTHRNGFGIKHCPEDAQQSSKFFLAKYINSF